MKAEKRILIWAMISLCCAVTPAALMAFVYPALSLPVGGCAWAICFFLLAACGCGGRGGGGGNGG